LYLAGVSSYTDIIRSIQQGHWAVLYLLGGENPYFARKIEEEILARSLPPEAQGFDLSVLYGTELKAEDAVKAALSFPMLGERRVVVVREAQHMFKTAPAAQAVAEYIRNAGEQNLLSLRFDGKIPAKLKKAVQGHKNVVVFEAKRVYENQVPALIREIFERAGFRLPQRSAMMLAEATGTDLLRAEKEAEKYALFFERGTEITPAMVEEFTGISKDYNLFELKSAIVTGQYTKALQIAEVFAQNPKEYPLLALIPVLYQFFVKLYAYHTSPHKNNPKQLAASLGINPYFLREYQTAARLYDMRRVSHVLDVLHDTDLKVKGVGAGQATYRDLLLRMIDRIVPHKIST